MSLSKLLVGDDGSASAAAARSWGERLAVATGGDLAVVDVDVEHGHAAAAGLLDRARDQHAELVILGRRGGGGFPALQLGSTAHQIAEHSPVPVAVVPPLDTPGPTESPPSRVAVGLDGSLAAAAAAAWAASLAALTSATIWAVHAVDVGRVLAPARLDDVAYADAIRSLAETMNDEWCAPFRDAKLRHETVLQEGGAAAVLLDAVRVNDVDLLVVGRRGVDEFSALAMGSVAHRAIAFAPCPTVVVPAAPSASGDVNAR